MTQVWILRLSCLSWFSSAICHKRKAPIIPEREIKNEEGKEKSFPSDVKWVRKDLYQVVTHLTSRLHTHPPINVNLTFVVATWVWNSSLKYYNPGHNILLLYNVLVEVWFTTSKMKLDIYYNRLGLQVSGQVTERLKT